MDPVQETSCQIPVIREKNITASRTETISFDKHPLDYLTVESSSIVERHPTFPGFRVSPMTLQWPYLTNLETEMVLLSGVVYLRPQYCQEGAATG
jgi:hypothetical protein